MTTSSEAQRSFIKSGLNLAPIFEEQIPISNSYKPFPIILDLGFEARFAKKWSGQASFTYSGKGSDDEINRV